MKNILLRYIKEFIYWLLFFVFFKVLFILYNFENTSLLTANEIWGVFFHGILMDLSAAGYCVVIPALLNCFYIWSPKFVDKLIHYYTIVMLMILCCLGFGDIMTYEDWGVRLNVGMFVYLKDWQGVLMNMEWYQWIFTIVLYSCVVGIWVLFHKKLFKCRKKDKITYVWPKSLAIICVMFLLLGLLIIPIRGGLKTSPLSFSNVWFSDKLYANHVACNYFWAFMSSVVHYKKNEIPVKYMSEDEVTSCIKMLDDDDLILNPQDVLSISSPNILLIVLESFSQLLVEEGYAPRLRELQQNGILWNNCYATGNRSDKGIAAIVAGYPALIRFVSILEYENKLISLATLPQYFVKNDYSSAFLYGGDINFYNTKILMMHSNVYDLTERSDYSSLVSFMSKWGAPDEYLYDKMSKKISGMQKKQPWFIMGYTLSSHPPFDIPYYYNKVSGTSTRARFCNSISYADSCLGNFIDSLKATTIWDSTLVVITSDHAAYMNLFGYDARHFESYRIPMLWTGGAVDTSMVISNVVSQTDLAETMLSVCGIEHETFLFSRNMFRKGGFATYYYDEFWGYVSDSTAYSVDLNTDKFKFYYSSSEDSLAIFKGKGYTQYILQDFILR